MTQVKKNIPALLLVLAFLTVSSCNKKEAIMAALSESEASEIIESSLQSHAGGLTSNLEDLTEQLVEAVSSGEICDSLYSTTIDKDYQGTQIDATYTSDIVYEMTCNALGIPQTATFSDSTWSTYSTQRIVSEDTAVFTGNVSGLQLGASSLLMSGMYQKIGTQAFTRINSKTVQSLFFVDLTEIEINKQNAMIVSGNGSFSLTGSTEETDFSFMGDIEFTGNQTAILTIDSTDYQLNWN